MLARSLLRVPNRAIARQSLGKSTVRHHSPPIHPIELDQMGQLLCWGIPVLEKGLSADDIR